MASRGGMRHDRVIHLLATKPGQAGEEYRFQWIQEPDTDKVESNGACLMFLIVHALARNTFCFQLAVNPFQ